MTLSLELSSSEHDVVKYLGPLEMVTERVNNIRIFYRTTEAYRADMGSTVSLDLSAFLVKHMEGVMFGGIWFNKWRTIKS